MKSKVKSALIISFDIKGITHKEFVVAGQTVNSAYYLNVLQRLCANVQRLRPELWQQKNWLLHHDNALSHTSFFTREFLVKNNTTVIPHPPYFSLFLRFKIKMKGRHFDTVEVIKAKFKMVAELPHRS
jgi:histone-lysine N-methyltransferase SETMAR